MRINTEPARLPATAISQPTLNLYNKLSHLPTRIFSHNNENLRVFPSLQIKSVSESVIPKYKNKKIAKIEYNTNKNVATIFFFLAHKCSTHFEFQDNTLTTAFRSAQTYTGKFPT